MKNSLAVAAGMLGAGVAAALPANGPDDDVTPSVSVFLGDTEPAAEMETTTSPLGRLTTLYDDGQTTVTWGGRLMEDFGWFDTDDSYPDPGEDGVEMRRARFFAHVKMDNIEAKAEFDFAGGDADFADAWLALPTPIGKLKAGHHKQPFGLEELTSSRFITFMERASIIDALAPGRDNGVSTGGSFDHTTWSVGAFKMTDSAANGTGDGQGSFTGRVTHAFGGGDDVIHLGLAAMLTSSGDVRFSARPEAHLLGSVMDTGTVSSDGTLALGGEAAWVNGPLSLQGEFMQGSIDSFGGGSDVDITGYYGFISYFLTGESRTYKKGKFDRVRPETDCSPGNCSGGAWELALRYSFLDYDEVDGSELTNITFGANWYLNPYARLMFNLLQSNFDDGAGLDEDMTALMCRLQIDW